MDLASGMRWQERDKEGCEPKMTVQQIIIEYLKKHNFDGLYSSMGECCCGIQDLMPCGGDGISNCEPGYKTVCDCGEGCLFHIVVANPRRPPCRLAMQS